MKMKLSQHPGTWLCTIVFIITSLNQLSSVPVENSKQRDPCKVKECKGHSTCITDANQTIASCQCLPGYTGENCDKAECYTGACSLGTCKIMNNTRYCVEKCPEKSSCSNGGECLVDIKTNLTQFCNCSAKETPSLFCTEPHCSPNMCSEVGGTCTFVNGTRVCTESCPASDNFCKNNGTCFINKSLNGTKQCLCPEGFTGPDCSIEICVNDFCETADGIKGNCHVVNNKRYCTQNCKINTCQNSGICYLDLNNKNATFCDCSGLEYEGPTCDQVKCTTDYCDKYGGTCKVMNNERYCSHPCDIEDKNHCGNGGVCFKDLRKNNSTHCDCDGTTFVGPTCNQAICTDDYCENGGECKVLNNLRYCDCSKVMYSGPSCQYPKCTIGFCPTFEQCHVDYFKKELYCDQSAISSRKHKDCIGFPCQNNGTCQIRFDSQPECDCSNTGFKGLFCETSVCENVNCNHGHCIPAKDRKVYCSCEPGYRGRSCEEKYCPENYCFNDGICSVNKDKLQCKCKPEYEGIRCEQRKICGPCEEGYCKFDINQEKYTCVCKETHIGEFCSIPKNCPKNYCNSGKCLLDKHPDKFICDCLNTGMSGTRCDIPIKNYR